MEQVNKIKVAMVCHLSNPDVRAHLPLDNRKLYAFVRKMLGLPNKGRGYGDFAPWDTDIIEDFRMHEDIELHVISAHSGLKKRVVSYEDKGVYFSFINCGIANLLKVFIRNDSLWRKMNPIVKDVRRLVDKKKPDIIILVGTENDYYACSILNIKDYPVYILCQTIYNTPERKELGMWNQKNASTELEIFKKHKFFGVYCKKHYLLLTGYNPHVHVFKFDFPTKGILLQPAKVEKEFDFVNFALTMDLRKGFPDTIRAIAIVKEKFPQVKLNLVGGSTKENTAELISLIEELGLRDNVSITPFFAKQSDLFLHIQKSRFAVLPCKLDNISGTMTQSMQLCLPLVVYKTTGTPTLNRERECVLIAEKENVEDLAAKMLELMENPEKVETLRKNARELQEKKAEFNKHNGDRLIANFRAIIDNFNNGTPLPKEQLFNPDIDD